MSLFSLESHYYHGTTKRYISLFGNIFSNIHIKRKSDDGKREEVIKVPIRYGGGSMFMKVPQDAESRELKQVSRTLPAMAFTLDNIYKDVSRKTNPMNRIQSPTFDEAGNKSFQFNRVPYNFIFYLMIRTKNTDDMAQIVEQIIPAFDGNLSVTVQDTTGVTIEQDIIISLQEIDIDDNFEKEMVGRLIEYKITFELKGYMYKRTQSNLVIKEIDIYAGYSLDDQQLIETVTEQGDITAEQNILSKMSSVFEELSSTPIKKVTRRRRKEQ